MPFDTSAADRIADAEALIGWASAARPGAALSYYTGDLANDRLTDENLNELGAAALHLAESGVIDVVQRRIGARKFEYQARRRRATA